MHIQKGLFWFPVKFEIWYFVLKFVVTIRFEKSRGANGVYSRCDDRQGKIFRGREILPIITFLMKYFVPPTHFSWIKHFLLELKFSSPRKKVQIPRRPFWNLSWVVMLVTFESKCGSKKKSCLKVGLRSKGTDYCSLLGILKMLSLD